ncbi:MAG: hypothetical protein S4CHLAM102_15750 [Chlamydiia bacterium]|nr:hypothetical protein [Chlamydiia bacterium]
MKNIFKIVVSSAVLITSFVCASEQNNQIPLDKKVVSGVLDNGLTYYIRHNGFPKNKASFRLVVNAGSIQEEANEQGLAHFLEHMCFRGSENFNDHAVIDYFESIGVVLGPDTNAYTGFDETVYMVEVPLDKESNLERLLEIGSDFAGRVKVDADIFDTERGVVLGELKKGEQSVMGRFSHHYFTTLLSGSKYENRLPIGLESVVKEAPVEVVQGFYDHWYRPDNMAVILVGDFDVDLVEEQVVRIFSKLEAKKVEDFTRPNLEEVKPNLRLFTDKELPFDYMIVDWLKPNEPIQTNDDLKDDLIKTLLIRTINREFQTFSSDPMCKFLGADFVRFEPTRHIGSRRLGIQTLDANTREGVKQCLGMYESFRNRTLTKEDVKTVLEAMIVEQETTLKGLDQVDHAAFSTQLIRQFLSGVELLDDEAYLKLCLDWLNHLDMDEVNQIKAAYFLPPSIENVMFSYTDHLNDQQEAQALVQEVLGDVQAEENTPEKVELMTTFDLSLQGEAGQIVEVETCSYDSKNFDAHYGYEMVKFKNGLNVIFIQSELDPGNVSITMEAKGGIGHFDPVDYSNVELGVLAAQYGSLNSIPFQQYDAYLKSKGVGMHWFAAKNGRGLSLSAPSNELELCQKVLHAAWGLSGMSKESFEKWKDEIQASQSAYSRMADYAYALAMEQSLFSSHPLFSEVDYSEANFERAEEIMGQLFSDPADFTVSIVGDFDLDQAREMARVYLGSLVSGEGEKVTLFSEDLFPKESVEVQFERGHHEKPRSDLVVPIYFSREDLTVKNSCCRDALVRILDKRLFDKVRATYGEGYFVKSYISCPNTYDEKKAHLHIIYQTRDDHVDKIRQVVLDEIVLLANEPVSMDELNSAKEVLSNHVSTSRQHLHGYASVLLNYLSYGGNLVEQIELLDVISDLTCEDLLTAAKKLSEEKRYVSYSLVSENE